MKRSKYKDWAVETLRDYQTMKAAADLLPERIKEIDSALNSIKSSAPDAAKVKGGGGVEDARIDKMVEKGLLESNLSNIKTKLSQIEKALSFMTDAERKVLFEMVIYREYGSDDKLCEALHCERSWLYKLRDNAIKKFSEVYYGAVDF